MLHDLRWRFASVGCSAPQRNLGNMVLRQLPGTGAALIAALLTGLPGGNGFGARVGSLDRAS
jgi:hypothetical protein